MTQHSFKVGDKVRHVIDLHLDGSIKFDDIGTIKKFGVSEPGGYSVAYVNFTISNPGYAQECSLCSLRKVKMEKFEGELNFEC